MVYVDSVLWWLENLLTGYKQRVVLSDQSSEWQNVTSGRLQVSVMGKYEPLDVLNFA